MATTNIGLQEVAQSQTFGQWLEAFNANMANIDSLPIPTEYGKNTTMEYLKLSNGKVIMWGRISHGTSYPCKTPWTRGYTSDKVTVDFPISLTKNNPTALITVQADTWKNVIAAVDAITYTSMSFWYWCDADDSAVSNSKECNIIVIGDWK